MNKQEFAVYVASLEHHEKRHWTEFRRAINRAPTFAELLVLRSVCENEEDQKMLEKRMTISLQCELTQILDLNILAWMLHEVREHSAPYNEIRSRILEILKRTLPLVVDIIGPDELYSLRLRALGHPSQVQLIEKRMIEVMKGSLPHEWSADTLVTLAAEPLVVAEVRDVHIVASEKLIELVIAIPSTTSDVPSWFVRLVEHRHTSARSLGDVVSKKVEEILTAVPI